MNVHEGLRKRLLTQMEHALLVIPAPDRSLAEAVIDSLALTELIEAARAMEDMILSRSTDFHLERVASDYRAAEAKTLGEQK